jgi:hypothetical protein
MALQLNNVQVIYEIIVYQIDQMSDCRLLVASGFISVQYIENCSSKGVNTLVFVSVSVVSVIIS